MSVKKTKALIAELREVEKKLAAVGDLNKSEIIGEACERLADLEKIADYYHGLSELLLSGW